MFIVHSPSIISDTRTSIRNARSWIFLIEFLKYYNLEYLSISKNIYINLSNCCFCRLISKLKYGQYTETPKQIY
jgi:hypothetical protein